MAFLSNAHTHSTWCDGKNSIPEMLSAACALGFVSLGFSGHASPGAHDSYSMNAERQHGYFAELRSLQMQPLPLRLWAGLELDALSSSSALAMANEADYRIGSTHCLYAEAGNPPAAVDGPAELLQTCVERQFAGDGLAAAQRFYQLSSDFLLAQRPDVIGHFDLIRKHARRIHLFDEEDPAYRRIALCALERAFPSGGVLELNTGGMARGYLPTPYPTLELLCAWREMGGRVTITSDCHDLRYLAHAFDLAEALLREAGFQSVVRLGTSNTLWEEVEL